MAIGPEPWGDPPASAGEPQRSNSPGASPRTTAAYTFGFWLVGMLLSGAFAVLVAGLAYWGHTDDAHLRCGANQLGDNSISSNLACAVAW